MILRGFLIFLAAWITETGTAPAQDIFLKYKSDQTTTHNSQTAKPSIFLSPNSKTTKKQNPVLAKPQYPKEIELRNKELQKIINQKIRAFKEWRVNNKSPKTPEEYLQYAALARSITHAQNLKRREILFAQMTAPVQQTQNPDPSAHTPLYSQFTLDKPRKIYNPPASYYVPPAHNPNRKKPNFKY